MCRLAYDNKISISNNLLPKHRFLAGRRVVHSIKLTFDKSLMFKIARSTLVFSRAELNAAVLLSTHSSSRFGP